MDLRKCLCPTSNWPVRWQKSQRKPGARCPHQPEVRIHSTHSLSFWLLSPSRFSSLFSLPSHLQLQLPDVHSEKKVLFPVSFLFTSVDRLFLLPHLSPHIQIQWPPLVSSPPGWPARWPLRSLVLRSASRSPSAPSPVSFRSRCRHRSLNSR
jgi:hypothetical protein